MTRPLHIAIDGNEANVPHRVGSNIYAFEIIKGLHKLTKNHPRIVVTVLLSSPAIADLPTSRENWQYKVVKPQFLWTQLALPTYLHLHQEGFDVFYTPGHYAPRHSSIPYVSSVMDLGFLKFPEQFKHKDLIQLRDWTRYSVKHAAKVIVISEHTKQDVTHTYHKSAKDVVIAPPDIDSSIHPVSASAQQRTAKKFHLTKPYILYVGTLQPRKNLVRLIEAFERTRELINNPKKQIKLKTQYELRDVVPFRDIQLVLAGKIGWLADDILRKVEHSPLKDHIVLTGFIDDATKNALYQGATGSVLVGLYEGFGIPALESLAHGIIPVVSNSSSLPEVVGKAGILVDPHNITSISDGLTTMLMLTSKEKAKFRREARKQLQHFKWQKSAQIVLDTLLEVAKKK